MTLLSISALLRKRASVSYRYYDGLNLYENGNILELNLEFDENIKIIGEVEENGHIYFPKLVISNKKQIFNSCTCQEQLGRDDGYFCAHGVAVMIAGSNKLEEEITNNKVLTEKELIHLEKKYGFYEIKKLEKDNLKILFFINITKNEFNNFFANVDIKIGVNRFYSVKDIRDFLVSFRHEEETLEDSSTFVYNPKIHNINDNDKLMLNFLYENILFDYNEKFDLPLGKFSYLLELIKDINYRITYNNKLISFKEENPKIILKLDEYDDGAIIRCDLTNYQILSEDSGLIIDKTNLYKCDVHFTKFVLPLLSIIKSKNGELIIKKENLDYFIGNILPYIIDYDDNLLKIKSSKFSTITKTGLITDVYIDRDGNDVIVDVKYHYGDDIFNVNSSIDNNVFRNYIKEKKIFNIFSNMSIVLNDDKIIVTEDSDIDYLISNIIPELFKIDNVNVFYSDNFKIIMNRKNFTYRGSVNVVDGLLSLEIDYDIPRDELISIFSAINLKRKYYRLKNGEFLNLDNDDSIEWYKIIKTLGVENKLKNKNINVAKYEAFHLDELISSIKSPNIERKSEFKKLVSDLKEPYDTEYKVPSNLLATLREYQIFGFKWLKTLEKYGFGGVLADDMGLGKTIQVITLLLDGKNKGINKPSLVISPSSVVYNWEEEIKKFAPSLKVLVLSGSLDNRLKLIDEINNFDVVITSYPLLRRDINYYMDKSFHYLILDEAQYIKNSTTTNFRVIKKINSNYKLALTGTPIENSLSELWSIFDFIMPGYLGSYKSFKDKFENSITKDNDTVKLYELINRVKPFILRRKKEEVLTDLPEKIETNLYVELNDNQRKIYMAYLNEAREKVSSDISEYGYNRSQIKIFSILTRLRQICCEPSLFASNFNERSSKLETLLELVDNLLASNHRILIFSQFTSMLDIIEKELNKNVFRIDGTTNVSERLNLINRFNNGEGDIFLISLKSGGTGINLTGADTVIHYDPWWNPAVEDQATDRAYRIGQDKRVHVYKLIARNTIEEKIDELKKIKKEIADTVIKSGEEIITNLSREEIFKLFDE